MKPLSILLLFCVELLTADMAVAQGQIILDDAQAVKKGVWMEKADTSAWGQRYQEAHMTTTKVPAASLRWQPDIPAAGIYALYCWLPGPAQYKTRHAIIEVDCITGRQIYTIDEQRHGGEWKYLGLNEWGKGKQGYVEIQNTGDTDDDTLFVAADAVKLVPVGEVIAADSLDGGQSCAWRPKSVKDAAYEIYYQPAEDLAGVSLSLRRGEGQSFIPLGREDSLIRGHWYYLGTSRVSAGCAISGEAELKAGFIKLMEPQEGDFVITTKPAQTIWGLGVEIQSDGFGPKYLNSDPVRGVPHDLIPSERKRLAKEMLHGFRYLRLAMGLWFRGQTPEGKNFVERYPGQVRELEQMVKDAGMEGLAVEYWSPEVYWKQTGILKNGGSLKNYKPSFLESMGNAMVRDLDYLNEHGLRPVFWGLQNEPAFKTGYSSLVYTNEQYYKTFKAVAPKIRQAYPHIFIHNDSQFGQEGRGSALIKEDTSVLKYVNGWSWHRIGKNANDQIDNAGRFNKGLINRPVFNNEYEYFISQVKKYSEEWRMVNTAQSIMNWFTFENAPTWFWLHALKPLNDGNLHGFALGAYRPNGYDNKRNLSNLKEGHFQYQWSNWYAMAGFLKYLPWNSVRQIVKEDKLRYDHRILAWKTPDGRLAFVVTNRSTEEFTFHIDMDSSHVFSGHLYRKGTEDGRLSKQRGKRLTIRTLPMSIAFYVQDELK